MGLADSDPTPSVRAAAEYQAGRKLEYDADYPNLIGQFKYDAVESLREGRGRGVLATCPIRRERSCVKELTRLLGYDTQLPSVKLSARGVIFLMVHDDQGEGGIERDIELLGRVDRLYQDGESLSMFTIRVLPLLRSSALDDISSDRMIKDLERIGSDLARIVSQSGPMFGLVGRKDASIAVRFTGRKLVGDRKIKTGFITALGKGFSEAYKGSVRVDLASPDVLIVVEALDVMGRKYLLMGVSPATWLVGGKLQLRRDGVGTAATTTAATTITSPTKKRSRVVLEEGGI